MSVRVCSTPGCGTLVQSGRCAGCKRRLERQRGTRQERGYDAEYDQAGRDYQRRMDSGEQFNCWRCGKPITGTRRGIDWVLGHDDHDRSIIRGPEHPDENYATATRIS